MEIFDLGYKSVCNKKKFNEIEDEELVSLAQKDIDEYRAECFWRCSMCGNTISYVDSLLDKESPYVHEMRCSHFAKNNKGKLIKCNNKMSLDRPDNKNFESEYFGELFARYNDTIIKESRYFDVNSDVFNEVYSTLCLVFFKSVAMFSRVGNRKKTSNKWFKSFFYISMKNRTVDIRKTSSYIKRTPSVQCACCGKNVGQITIKHLMGDGHDSVKNKILSDIGRTAMSDSGEILYYEKMDELIEARAIQIGRTNWEKLSVKKRKELFKNEAYKAYYQLYPNAYFKNNVLSTNENFGDDSDFDIESQRIKSVTNEPSYEDRMMDDLNISNAVDIIMDTAFSKSSSVSCLDHYFDESYTGSKKMEVVRQILRDKISYTNLKNTDSDKPYVGIQKGLTSAIFKIVKNDKECKRLIAEKCLSRK